jgi:hypothetical protein
MDSFTRLYNELIGEGKSNDVNLKVKSIEITIKKDEETNGYVLTVPKAAVVPTESNEIKCDEIKEGFEKLAKIINEAHFIEYVAAGQVVNEGDGCKGGGCDCGPKDGKKKAWGPNDNEKCDTPTESECDGRKKKLDPSKQKLHRR